jgi:hypothetical protein
LLVLSLRAISHSDQRNPVLIHLAHFGTGAKKKTARPTTQVTELFLNFKAAIGFEPMNGGFADLCLTTWLCRQSIPIM